MTTPTRDRLTGATADLFRRQGYHGTGVKQIAAAADAQLASLYHFFPGGKVELAESAIRIAGRAYEELVLAVWDAEPDVVASVRAIFAGAAAVLEATDFEDACPIETVALEVASTDERLRAATAEVFEGWIAAGTARFVAAGIGQRDSRRLALAVVAGLEGAFVLARACRSTEALHAAGDAAAAAVERGLSRRASTAAGRRARR
ncbi:MAG: TetR/AcrR family transcriptional regulator [Acidimicrobiia bacterium]